MTIEEELRKRIAELENELKQLKISSQPKIRGSYKNLSQLVDPVYIKKRKLEIQQQLGDNYQIAELAEELSMSPLDFLAFQRTYRLTNKTVDALAKLPQSQWPTSEQLKYAEKKFIAKCGGFDEVETDGVRMIWMSDPAKTFAYYLENLKKTVWKGKYPNQLEVVVGGDKDKF